MGPQHPSTHGVLRLVLELEGETVTQARSVIGYLHTGIEKNCEYRNWTQGITFVTRMDYLAPLFNEAAYCLGVEKLLGVEAPRRAQVARVLLMELNRIGSHLVCLATGGMELGALTGMTAGFREREEVLAPAGVPHRPADEPRLHPPRRAGAGLPRGLRPRRSATSSRSCARGCRTTTSCSPASRSGATGWRTSATCRSTAAWRWAPPARSCAARACPGTCARSRRTAATRSTSSRSRPPPRPTATPATGCGWPRCTSRSRSSSRPWTKMEPGPVMVADRKIAWPAQLSVGSDGMGNSLEHVRKIMGQSMESLIHHFKLVTEGFAVPAGPGLLDGRVAARRAGLPPRLRRRHPAAARARPRPQLREPADDAGDERGRHGRRRHRRRREHRPGHGRCRPVTTSGGQPEAVGNGYVPGEVQWEPVVPDQSPLTPSSTRPPGSAPSRSSPGTRSRGRRCCRCCTWCSRSRGTSARTASATAPRCWS